MQNETKRNNAMQPILFVLATHQLHEPFKTANKTPLPWQVEFGIHAVQQQQQRQHGLFLTARLLQYKFF